jgi:hypothetical protein
VESRRIDDRDTGTTISKFSSTTGGTGLTPRKCQFLHEFDFFPPFIKDVLRCERHTWFQSGQTVDAKFYRPPVEKIVSSNYPNATGGKPGGHWVVDMCQIFLLNRFRHFASKGNSQFVFPSHWLALASLQHHDASTAPIFPCCLIAMAVNARQPGCGCTMKLWQFGKSAS